MCQSQLSLALVVVCGCALIPVTSIATNPSPEVDIRSADGKVIIAVDQIRSYEWATHTLTLAPKVRGELAKGLLKDSAVVSGIPFVVAINGKVIYQGTFTTIVSSRSFSTPVVVVDAQVGKPELGEDQLQIQLGYPTVEFFKGEDPRVDKNIQDALQAGGKLAKAEPDHTEWLAKALREMQTIKPGMIRKDLWKVFQEEGSLSNRTQRRYAYRECPYIKVDVRFEAVGALEDKLTQSPNDRITQISKPFLEWSIID